MCPGHTVQKKYYILTFSKFGRINFNLKIRLAIRRIDQLTQQSQLLLELSARF